MNYHFISNSVDKVSEKCLGTAYFGTKVSVLESFKVIDAFVEHGGNFIDTASIYANWITGDHESEKLLGRYLRENPNSRIVICTKGMAKFTSNQAFDEIKADLLSSVANLNNSTIDIYMLHKDYKNIPVNELIDILIEFKNQGYYKEFGLSNWSLARFKEACEYAKKKHTVNIVVSQIMWNLAKENSSFLNPNEVVSIDKDSLAFYECNKTPVMAYSSNASGYFSKLSKNQLNENDFLFKLYNNKKSHKLFQLLNKMSKSYSCSFWQLTQAYFSSLPITVIPIIGVNSKSQLIDQLKETEIVLLKDEIMKLHDLKFNSHWFDSICTMRWMNFRKN